jgi:hypothetical protein
MVQINEIVSKLLFKRTRTIREFIFTIDPVCPIRRSIRCKNFIVVFNFGFGYKPWISINHLKFRIAFILGIETVV